MEKNITLILFITGWVVIVIGIISGIDSTIYYNATQYVADGEKPDPIRITQILNDIVYPLQNGGLLIGLSYIIKYLKKDKAAQ
ncbi:hypothetical protein KW850_18530 [Bacillus sp. sid0103]|uniref:hypothetical protein n=1 Tax=Bacillus sp. sid0103 TaxID=2856337 RepID=UPI001C490CAA|nr:hypothetical protein [Bacillus sp. sid0103]MBV7507262.1 hypothetical protein [Bacillus sp. sid0103]